MVAAIKSAKRAWRPWYLMADKPICPTCGIPCKAETTRHLSDGRIVQQRYCPKCRHSMKTPV